MIVLILQRLFLEALVDIVYFPLWWYTGGLLVAARAIIRLVQIGNENLAPGLWLKNLFVPMFGQNDFQGRVISFLMRFVQLIFRSLLLGVWIVVGLCLAVAWLAWPVVVVYELVHSLFA